MKYHGKQMTDLIRKLTIALAASAALGLSACDNSGGGESSSETQSDAQDASSVETAVDNAASEASTASATAEAAEAASDSLQILIHRDDNGVPTGEITMGNPDADLEMIEYLSVTCGHCARHHVTAWQNIKENYVASGKVKTTFRMFARSPLDELISMLPFCGTDEQAYPMLDMIMTRQNQWMRGANGQEVLNNLAGLVRRAGMSRASFDACVRTQPLLDNIRATTRAGAEGDNVNATPAFVIGSQTLSGALPFESFVEVIEEEL